MTFKRMLSSIRYPLLAGLLFFHSGVMAQSLTHATRVGDMTLTILSEAQNDRPTDRLLNFTEADRNRLAPDGTFKTGLNIMFVQAGGKNVLIDTGFGTHLFENLASLKVKPEQIDAILLTHMHRDHISGLLKEGKVTFPESQLYISRPEFDYWKDNDAVKPVLTAYEGRITLFEPDDIGSDSTLLPGISAWKAYGHTPGHTVYRLHSQGQSALVIGDLTHAIYVQAPLPDVAITYDVDPQMAVASRRAVFEYISEQGVPVAGMHVPFPGMGKILAAGDNGYTFQAD